VRSLNVLSLDFDGVLHPANDSVLLDLRAQPWQIALQAKTQKRFVWMPVLMDILDGATSRFWFVLHMAQTPERS